MRENYGMNYQALITSASPVDSRDQPGTPCSLSHIYLLRRWWGLTNTTQNNHHHVPEVVTVLMFPPKSSPIYMTNGAILSHLGVFSCLNCKIKFRVGTAPCLNRRACLWAPNNPLSTLTQSRKCLTNSSPIIISYIPCLFKTQASRQQLTQKNSV
jgi:hypothetical protein